ncbi:hypothetical protein ACOCG7_33930 (plasmid) [Paraburkholderia sp. DD10]|uniref:Uncharacterized protein n=1 Tax=Paraburkholderia terricola TaxID=169427 RepID=A0ABU1LZV7_9BURK|nr:hypothetical protein [Paraburkholderia terricola]MDR6412299.1 hypothetical protein [Paraburkholderia terricola]MDR6484634.1 hypothetical protein [Paraburkholderia terricola]
MRKEYDLQTDVLSTIVATTPVTKSHAQLLAAFATRTDYRGTRYVKTRDEFGEQPARILGADGSAVAADYHAWIDAQLAAHGGSAREVWRAHKDAGYLLVEIQPVLHYFVHDRDGDQDNFTQFAVWEEQAFVEREVFPRDDRWGLPDADELRRGSTGGALVEQVARRTLGTPSYRLNEAIDMQRFAALAGAVFADRQRADGDRRLIETDTDTGETRIVSVRELTPGYDRQRWRGRRFFDDWSASSAGRAGERICTRWAFNTSDYTDPQGRRYLDFVPGWTHTRKIAALKNTHKLDVYSLYGKLTQFDERIGTPFAWYFYGLHGNLVKSGQMERVLEAAEDGLIVLPEHDYRVLRQWGDNPYGF